MSRSIRLSAAGTLALGLLFVTTEPNRLPSILLIAPFGLIFIVLFLSLKVFISRWNRSPLGTLKLAVLAAALPTLLLVLRSLGQLTIRDVITVVALFCLAYFYLGRASSPSRA